jgi:hypothetical protein
MNENESDHEDGQELNELMDSITKLSKDLREAAITLGREEAQYLVQAYYNAQDERKRFNNQQKQLVKAGKPDELIGWMKKQYTLLETQIGAAMDAYSYQTLTGRWLRDYVFGVGPVTAAGLLAHLDLVDGKGEKINYVGNWYNFAGLNPTVVWKKKSKRPWNTDLKTLCWKIGQSFQWGKNNDKSFYGTYLIEKQAAEWKDNLDGKSNLEENEIHIEEQATSKAEDFRKSRKTSSNAYKWYNGQICADWAKAQLASGGGWPQVLPKAALEGKNKKPMLPPAHIEARARRWTVKLFLSHLFEVMHLVERGQLPPDPYVLTHVAGHNRKIEVPHLEEWARDWDIVLRGGVDDESAPAAVLAQ